MAHRLKIAAACALWAGITSPTRVRAEDRGAAAGDAQALFEQGVAAATKKDFEQARQAFAASHRLKPSQEALFAWAQAERLSGHCDKAVPLYKKFLEGNSIAEHTQAAEIGLGRCQEAQAARAPTPGSIGIEKNAPAPPTGHKSRLATAGILTVGVVSLGAGIAFITLSIRDDNGARDAATYTDYRTQIERARWERPVGIASGAVGVSLVTWGLFRVFSGPVSPRLAGAPLPGGGQLTWWGTF